VDSLSCLFRDKPSTSTGNRGSAIATTASAAVTNDAPIVHDVVEIAA